VTRIAHSSQPHATVSHAAVDLVVLMDYLVADPRMVPYMEIPIGTPDWAPDRPVRF
jgi:hypothetical protein